MWTTKHSQSYYAALYYYACNIPSKSIRADPRQSPNPQPPCNFCVFSSTTGVLGDLVDQRLAMVGMLRVCIENLLTPSLAPCC